MTFRFITHITNRRPLQSSALSYMQSIYLSVLSIVVEDALSLDPVV